MIKAEEILKKYWGFDEFRTPQKEIINAVLSGSDSFGLMPTGGGKSICFQVPALMKDGIGLVISPLIALMKDQVENLSKRDIKALALTGGISSDETITLLDNCLFGNYKFLYLSPERLEQDWVLEKIKNLPLNLIAIDEAHCVSQWGHDFRPSYLKINRLKEFFPNVPFLAVTASATQRVKKDIIEQLKLEKPAVFQKSFARENIAYMVIETEDKLHKIEQILKKNPESSIIYVRNRKSCFDVSNQLQQLGFKATFYHGGLAMKEKAKNMDSWMNEKVQVMVATNAFGMGIDKANVKTIIHIQLPENIENYYQEAGRAGRNGEKSYAALLVGPSDVIAARGQFIAGLPDKEFLKIVYIKLCNYFQIAYGEGINEQFPFNLNHFCSHYNFPIIKTYSGLQFLDRQGIISFTQEYSEKINLQFIIESKEVIRYISLNPSEEEIILAFLRTYPGIYEYQTAVNLSLVARKSNNSEEQVEQVLNRLKEKGIVDYIAKNNDAMITFNEVREDERTINRVSKYLEKQNDLKKEQIEDVFQYVSNHEICKSRFILEYFGEKNTTNCGICSYCISKKEKNNNSNQLSQLILNKISEKPYSSRELEKIMDCKEQELIFALQELLDEEKIIILPNNKYTKA
ncbi:RecQ family ATP-dependent DNA helicase [Flavobacterium lacus]|uniref:ATP-dependent DNA helicase RecQ n=1 Tax=Flavobacterium lacus TaxID=1353778 RepID=A0A328WXX2_9FLAO|nr:ATP-dependent DNA helicase RecQ [Flavobacterium lacus]RAR51052.1 ATP-dependent DNA helicase RecQ [Flavobacterium lacus]